MNGLSPDSPPPVEPGSEAERMLVFAVGGQEFALPLGSIVEIAPARTPTPVPGAEPGVLGIVPFRGAMVTVFDGRLRLGLPGGPAGRAGSMIVLRDSGELIGLVVDAVARVAPIAPAEREPLPAALRLARADLFLGVAPRRDGGYVLLLDMAAVLRVAR
ncbi:MAG TPA: chemotaxis protein CheW [Candidatus Polarisedimenticolia bacterium]|nr:chemotaxis protein CheW [Candidatus Polarisedimenticolia bacterium]